MSIATILQLQAEQLKEGFILTQEQERGICWLVLVEVESGLRIRSNAVQHGDDPSKVVRFMRDCLAEHKKAKCSLSHTIEVRNIPDAIKPKT